MTQEKEPGVALCLSGGGFRATLFHLGVVKYLSEIGWLDRVTHVYSVSGGSILAAHMGLNWEKYKSTDSAIFRSASDELVRFAQFDLRGRIIRRLPFRSRTLRLMEYYDSFFRHAELNALPISGPTFCFLATSMTGQLCAFDRNYFTVVSEHDAPGRYEPLERFPEPARYPARSLFVSQAVAASSAFPAFFPPLPLDLPVPQGTRHLLTDGGVFDNLGISRIFPLVPWNVKQKLNPIIVSDASARFDHEPTGNFGALFSRAARTTDIMMKRIASLENEHWHGHKQMLVIDIGDVVKQRDLSDLPIPYVPQSPRVQLGLKEVRTDFDAFEDDLVRVLVQHGHEAAIKTIKKRPVADGRNVTRPWDPMSSGADETSKLSAQVDELEKLVARAAERPGLWNASDAVAWLNPFAIILTLSIMAWRWATKLLGLATTRPQRSN